MWLWSRSHGPRWPHRHMGMDQYLLIPFLGGWTSINPSYFDVNYRGTRFWHFWHIWCLASGPVRSSFCRSQANKRCSCSKKSRSCSNNWVWCWADIDRAHRADSFCHVSMVSSRLLVPSCHETKPMVWGTWGQCLSSAPIVSAMFDLKTMWICNIHTFKCCSLEHQRVRGVDDRTTMGVCPGTWEPHPHQITCTMAAMTSGLMGFDQGGNQALDIFPGDDLPEDDEETCFLYFPVWFPNETAMTKNYAQVQGGPMMGEAGRHEALWFPENPNDFLITPQWIEDYWLSDDHTFYGG